MSPLQEVTVSFREQKVILKSTFKKLLIMFARAELRVVQDGDESQSTALSVDPVLTTWRDGLLGIGGLLGEIIHNAWIIKMSYFYMIYCKCKLKKRNLFSFFI